MLIFVAKKEGVDLLSQNLKLQQQLAVGGLHGDMQQQERDQVLKAFKQGQLRVLVATDVAARGLDIKAVKAVINYDVAKDQDAHVHRIGRTGRAGEKGLAYTLVTLAEDRAAGELVRVLEANGQPVSEDLLNLAMKNDRFRKQRQKLSSGVGRKSFTGRKHQLAHPTTSSVNVNVGGGIGGMFVKAQTKEGGKDGLGSV